MRDLYFKFFRSISLSCLMLSLNGCMETASDLNAISEKPQIHAPSIPVALISMEGATETVSKAFDSALASEASKRGIILVPESSHPRFKLKGYMSTYNAQGKTHVTWVWDIYDTHLKRAQRIDGSVILKQAGNEPWSMINDETLKSAASDTMNGLAGYLSTARSEVSMPRKIPRTLPIQPLHNPALASLWLKTAPIL